MTDAVRPPVESYGAVLLDMNSTCMFEGDRFSPRQEYLVSYQEVGGGDLSFGDVQSGVHACYAAFLRDYEDPRLTGFLPSLYELLPPTPVFPRSL